MDWFQYIITYPDLFYRGIFTPGKILEHWENVGKKEGRTCNRLVNRTIVLYINPSTNKSLLTRLFPQTTFLWLTIGEMVKLEFMDKEVFFPFNTDLLALLNRLTLATIYIAELPDWSLLSLLSLFSLNARTKLLNVSNYRFISGVADNKEPNLTLIKQLQSNLTSWIVVAESDIIYKAHEPHYVTLKLPPDTFLTHKIDVAIVSKPSELGPAIQRGKKLLVQAELRDEELYGAEFYSTEEELKVLLAKYQSNPRRVLNLKYCLFFQPYVGDFPPKSILYPGVNDLATVYSQGDLRITALVNYYLVNTTLYLRQNQKVHKNKKRDRTAVIVEPRKHYLLEAVIRNVMYNLPDWDLMIFTAPKLFDWIQSCLPGWDLNLTSTPPDLPFAKYNRLLRSAEFWNQIDSEHILIFQTDALMLRPATRSLEEFLTYPLVGGRQICYFDKASHLTPGGRGINGGFSLRRKSAMLECIAKVSVNDVQKYRLEHKMEPTLVIEDQMCEDIYYTHALEMLEKELPTDKVLDEFCIQEFHTPQAYALHGFTRKHFDVKTFFQLFQAYGIAM